MNFDPGLFKRLERSGYDRLGPRYLAAAAARRGLVDALLDAAELAPGLAALDLAAGPGQIAQAALERMNGQGLAIASDISAGQLACCPSLPRAVADAEALPFAAASFDRIFCGLGLMFFPNAQAALEEMRRVLRGNGRVAISVWGTAANTPLVAAALSCMRRLLPPPKVERPSIFRYGDRDVLLHCLAQGGFGRVEIRECTLVSEFSDAAAYWQAFLDLAGGAAESLSRLPPAKQQELAAGLPDELAPYRCHTGFRMTSTVLVATAAPV